MNDWPRIKAKLARVTRASDQAITNTTFTSISFASALTDSLGAWAAGSPTRLTIPTSGPYLVTFNGYWQASAGGTRRPVRCLLNGTKSIGDAGFSGATISGTGNPRVGLALVREFIAGDYIEFQVFQDSGGSLNFLFGDEDSPIGCIAQL